MCRLEDITISAKDHHVVQIVADLWDDDGECGPQASLLVNPDVSRSRRMECQLGYGRRYESYNGQIRRRTTIAKE
jgi:hypothetical protein